MVIMLFMGQWSVYGSMVGYRRMLVDGHGNFGSMDGDGAAAASGILSA